LRQLRKGVEQERDILIKPAAVLFAAETET